MLLYRNVTLDERAAGIVFPKVFPGSEDSDCPAGAVVSFWFTMPIQLGFSKIAAVDIDERDILGFGEMRVNLHAPPSWYTAFKQPFPAWWWDENEEHRVPEVYVSAPVNLSSAAMLDGSASGCIDMHEAVDMYLQGIRGECEGLVAQRQKPQKM